MTQPQDTTPTLIQVSIGRPQTMPYLGRRVRSAIDKRPVAGPVMVRRLNIDGDRQADLRVHGGEDKAVYCYPAEHYPLWESELGRPLPYATFGENLTVSGLLEDRIRIGDVFSVGDAVLQVTQPRFPCFKLGVRMGDPHFLRQFQVSGRSGFYCRVLQEGLIEAGRPVRLLESDLAQPTIAGLVGRRNKIAALFSSS